MDRRSRIKRSNTDAEGQLLKNYESYSIRNFLSDFAIYISGYRKRKNKYEGRTRHNRMCIEFPPIEHVVDAYEMGNKDHRSNCTEILQLFGAPAVPRCGGGANALANVTVSLPGF